jgi:uncharacterized protein YbaR (Trm112 family)
LKKRLLDILICPACLPRESRLVCETGTGSEQDEIYSGTLRCPVCRSTYPIHEGTATLLSESAPPRPSPSRYETPPLLSAYLWSHYADLFGDREANTAYGSWAEMIPEGSGFCLDAGCSVGRFSFEMTRKGFFVVGIDSSPPFIHAARRLMLDRRLDFFLPEEGILHEEKSIFLPEEWRGENVEFMVADAQRLPFPSALFSSLASPNLLDKLPFPLIHLREMNRVAQPTSARFLFSDPFSWSAEVTGEENWLGGTDRGPFAGRGLDNVISILRGDKGDLSPHGDFTPPWDIRSRGKVWWTIRNHLNHFERIRSCFVLAERGS